MSISELFSKNQLELAKSLLDSSDRADDDDLSVIDTPGETTDADAYEKQLASLQTYLNALPYNCESVEGMHDRLEDIVEKLYICAKTKNWTVLTTWDGMLQCWLLMHYPMKKTTRVALVHLYYELCLIPGIEPRLIRSWDAMLSRLLFNKSGLRRKLETADIELPWRPLWRVLQKELWPKGSLQVSSDSVNILLSVSEHCKRYYPPSEIPDMLETFLPLLTKETLLTMVPILTSFLPPSHAYQYLPACFTIWSPFNSSLLDDRFIEMCGNLSEEHVSAPIPLEDEDCGMVWKDVGIWSHAQWNTLVGKTFLSMGVPMASGLSSTSSYADLFDGGSGNIKKPINRINPLAKIFVYSMSVDGEIHETTPKDRTLVGSYTPTQGFTAGSRAIDSLDRMITSFESFFHPTNTGSWTLSLTAFIQRLVSEFTKRWNEEELETCKTPTASCSFIRLMTENHPTTAQLHRLTPAIRRAFVNILKTPALLAMFSKDPVSMSFAQGALRSLAMLEPQVIMPELLERAYGGLEVVNETHRTTAVLSTLSGIARPLATGSIWLGGQKHVVPLLELCIPGIDMNDPIKTVCTTMFIVAVVQHIMIGDLSQGGLSLSGDEPGYFASRTNDTDHLPEGTELGDTPQLSRSEEYSLVRDSTSAFADWVVSLFRRVFALYENLPEEGGKKNTTGGKQEESVLKSIKSMLDIVCLHLSDQLFDLVLNLVYEYATTNARSNAVRAFGQLVACLARVDAKKTIARFFPHCVAQIEEELKHGASSIRTTSAHSAVPSDTTLHWNMAILRGCLGYGGTALLKYKVQIIRVLRLLVEKTKSERSYNSAGRLITRILSTVSGVYPLNSRFVNTEEWDNPEFSKEHVIYWGRQYEAQEVIVEWHVPTDSEILFVLEIIDQVGRPALQAIEALVKGNRKWDNVSRNDFCRYLQACRSILLGLPTFTKENSKNVVNPCVNEEHEVDSLVMSHLNVASGFALTDPNDPRYQKAVTWRGSLGTALLAASSSLRHLTGGEDHTDAVISVTRAIDAYLLSYAVTRTEFESLQKNYAQARDLNRSWLRQKDNSRLVFLKRAQVYHSARLHLNSLYRRRSELDDELIKELVELSISPYTRVRRHAQSILHHVTGYYVRTTRYILPSLFKALEKSTDPDRMKGALYILWNKAIASYALGDQSAHKQYLLSVLDCQHEEKPSIQKIVASIAQDCLSNLNEEATSTETYRLRTPRLDDALIDLEKEITRGVNQHLLEECIHKATIRVQKREAIYHDTVSSILNFATKPATHWRYVQMAIRFLYHLLRRDVAPSQELVNFFLRQSISPQPVTRSTAQRGLVKLLVFVKIRVYSKSDEELWLHEWKNPLSRQIAIGNPNEFLPRLQRGSGPEGCYLDKIQTGFIAWSTTIKGYRPASDGDKLFTEGPGSQPPLQVIQQAIKSEGYLQQLSVHWGQESNKTGSLDIRSENALFIKYLAKLFGENILDEMTEVIDPLLFDLDKHKQRAGAEILVGILRGSKHWTAPSLKKLWSWTSARLNRILTQLKPETISLWESVLQYQLNKRDPRRNNPLINWIFSVPIEFNGDSSFEMTKPLTLFKIAVESLGIFFNPKVEPYVRLLFQNANSGYAEIRQQICQSLYVILNHQWQPWYPSVQAFLQACSEKSDPLLTRRSIFMPYLQQIMVNLPKWRGERLRPPRVNQSEYDKVGLTLLQWLWVTSHGPTACLMFPYTVALMPEILRMSELNDSSELQSYSSAVLYVVSAVTPPAEDIEKILNHFMDAIKSSTSWRIRLHAVPPLLVFFYQNLLSISQEGILRMMDVLLDCLGDDNVEVRETAAKAFSGVVRCSQRQTIVPLKNRFVTLARKITLPPRRDPTYAESLRKLHSAILGICALMGTTPYSVESWLPPLTEVLAPHATDPPPISTTIRKCASEFKKTHQDTWHKDQHMFNEDQLQCLSTMLVGTSYYA